MALEVYIDDSDDPSSVYMLAGYVASAEKWGHFSDAWDSELKNPELVNGKLRTLAYFKMKQAASLTGEFQGWDSIARDKKCLKLVSLIKETVIGGLSFGCRNADFSQVMKGQFGKPSRNPYFFLCYGIIRLTLKEMEQHHVTEKVDFIFDDQDKESDLVQEGWEPALSVMSPSARDLIGKKPTCRNDEETMPLQAADMIAWHFRRWYFERDRGIEYTTPIMRALSEIPHRADGWGTTRLTQIKEGIDEARRALPSPRHGASE